MGRKPQPKRLTKIYKVVEKHQGAKPGLVARLLEIPRSSVTRVLPAMEDAGYLLSEDDDGGLWSYSHSEDIH